MALAFNDTIIPARPQVPIHPSKDFIMSRTLTASSLLLLAALFCGSLFAEESKSDKADKTDKNVTELFNGKDLTGWGYKTGPAFDGKTEASDERYCAKDGMIVVNPGKGLRQMWTTAKFPGDFELRLEFRAAVNADSGLFLRGPQLQVRDYLVAGPYKTLTKYKPQDWNEIIVIVKDNVAHCTCNGEVLEAALKLPETGSIGLEADRGQMEYRNLRLTPVK